VRLLGGELLGNRPDGVLAPGWREQARQPRVERGKHRVFAEDDVARVVDPVRSAYSCGNLHRSRPRRRGRHGAR
jgi:hypothetical protein